MKKLNLIQSIKDKINTNTYIILGDVEYLKNESIIADMIYNIIKNYRLICESLDIYMFYKSRSLKRKLVEFLKFLIPIMINYINEKEKKPSIFKIKSTLKFFRKVIRALLHCGKFASLIGMLLCVMRRI